MTEALICLLGEYPRIWLKRKRYYTLPQVYFSSLL